MKTYSSKAKTFPVNFLMVVIALVAIVIALVDYSSMPVLSSSEYVSKFKEITAELEWYEWVYAVSVVVSFLTIVHEIYVSGELLLNELVLAVFYTFTPFLNTLHAILYIKDFKIVLWRKY